MAVQVNNPPPTGLLVPPQSPSGAVVTNTGRTTTGTQAFHAGQNVIVGGQQGTPTLTPAAAAAEPSIKWFYKWQ